MTEKIIALLPMKAHSERVEGKNFRKFNGKPLFRWMLDTILSIEEVATVVINTDARQILADNGIIDTNRIVIRDRKPELCGDHTSMNLIIADDISAVPADIYMMTHTTNPLLSATRIKQALESFKITIKKSTADSLFTVNRFQTRFYRQDGTPVNHDPGKLIRTQDLEVWYEENSNLYIFTEQSFASTNSRIGRKPLMFESSRIESIDIDTEEDWELAEIVCKHINPTTEN